MYVVDPAGSGLYEYVKTGQVKGRENYHGRETVLLDTMPGKSFAEGIGNDKLTRNFDREDVDGALHVTDIEAVEMAYYLQRYEGLSVGPSAAMNVVGALKIAQKLGPGHTIATILCDGGERYKSKLGNKLWLAE